MQRVYSLLARILEDKKGTYLKSKLLTYSLDVQEKAGLLQWAPKMIDISPIRPKSQLFNTGV